MSLLDHIPCDRADELVAQARAEFARAGSRKAARLAAATRLAIMLFGRFRCTNRRTDLDESVELMREACPLAPELHPDRATAEVLLANVLCVRQTPEDLDEAVTILRRRLDKARPAGGNRSADSVETQRVRLNLGIALFARHVHTGRTEDQRDAIDLLEAVSEGGAPPLTKALARTHLAAALLGRYRSRMGRDEGDLHKARELAAGLDGSGLAAALPSLHPLLEQVMSTLNAIDTAPQAGHPAADRRGPGPMAALGPLGERAQHAIDLTTDLMAFGFRGDLSQLDAAIAERAAEAVDPDEHDPDVASRLSTLAGMRHLRYRTRRMSSLPDSDGDLAEATRLAREAVTLSRGFGRATAYLTLGACLIDRYLAGLGGPETVDEALDALRRAETGSGLSDEARMATRASISEALVLRGIRDGSLDDLDEAVRVLDEYHARLPSHSRMRPIVGVRVAAVLQTLADATGDTHDALRAAHQAREAAVAVADVSLVWGYDAARMWADWSWRRGLLPEAAEAYRHTLVALHRLAGVQVGRAYAEQVLARQTDGIAARAAYALVRTGRPADAAVALETGRAMLLAQALDRERVDLAGLERAGRADLAERYRRAAARVSDLERAAMAERPRT